MAQQYGLSVDSFQDLGEIEWILLRPDSFVGSCDKVRRQMFCYNVNNPDPAERKVRQKWVTVPEALDSIVCEILGNAADNVLRSRDEVKIDPLQIEVTMTQTTFIVKNYGCCIPVQQKQWLNGVEWIPTQVFTNLRTSSNYNDGKVRMYVGKNGLGAKLTAIFSLEVYYECADPGSGLLFRQRVSRNRTIIHPPDITSYPRDQPGYTLYQFQPDFARFGYTEFDQECLEIFAAHAVEIAYARKIPVFFNNVSIRIDKLSELSKYFCDITKGNSIEYTDPNGVFDLCMVDTPNEAVCLSMANAMITREGGVHLDEAYHVIIDRVKEILGSSLEASGTQITKRDFTNHVSIFLSVNVNQPKYGGQTKSKLTGPTPKIIIPPDQLKGIKRWKLVQEIYLSIEQKMKNKVKSSEAQNRRDRKVKGAGVYERNFSANVNFEQTAGIFIEGESASGYATKYIALVGDRRGRDYYGQLPLHGKIPNVLKADFIDIMENKDIKNIKKFYGIEEETDYTNPNNRKKLKYATALGMTDPDTDGKHILALVVLLFMCRYISLVQTGYIKFLRIPTIRVKKSGFKLAFYTYTTYQRWRDALIDQGENPDLWTHEYFKGLGSSENHHVAEDYNSQKIITFIMDNDAINNVVMAFHRTKREERKEWIMSWIHGYMENIEIEAYVQLPLSAFINHELIEFAEEALERGIPQIMDGLKESQRKAFFAARKRLIGSKKDKMKTAQVAYHAAEITCYKHGEHCLADAITNMAYDFPGTNNMPNITARGMMGTRSAGGQDAAADRYTFISLPGWINMVYRKEDNPLLERIKDEGELREIRQYYPIIPMVLVNGATGVGVGWSTEIPTHNPLDLAFWIQQRLSQIIEPLANHQLPRVYPWYRGWNGTILASKKPGAFSTRGNFQVGNGVVIITELPIGCWFNKYKEKLETWEEEGKITGFIDRSDDMTPLFILEGFKETPTYNTLDLIAKHSYTNMTVLIPTGTGDNIRLVPHIFHKLEELLEVFFQMRLKIYYQRKEYQLKSILDEIIKLNLRLTLINLVRSDQIIIKNRPRAEIKSAVEGAGFEYSLFKSIGSDEYNDDAVSDLEKQVQEKKLEYDRLNSIPPESIWWTELEEFILKWSQDQKCERSTFQTCLQSVVEPGVDGPMLSSVILQ